MPREPTPARHSGRCNPCGKQYADLIDHFKKKHKGDRFTKKDISDTEVVVCICGRLVLNANGLNKHRLRFNCPAYSPSYRSTQSLSRSLTPAPSISSLLQNAASGFGSALSSAPSASGHVPARSSVLSSPLSSLSGTPPLTPPGIRSSFTTPSPSGLSVGNLWINSSPLTPPNTSPITPTRSRSSSRVVTRTVYNYDQGDYFGEGMEEDEAGWIEKEEEEDIQYRQSVQPEVLQEEEEVDELEEEEVDELEESGNEEQVEDNGEPYDDRSWCEDEERTVSDEERWEPEQGGLDQGGMEMDLDQTGGGTGQEDLGEDEGLDSDLEYLLGEDEQEGSPWASDEQNRGGQQGTP
ncbi:hypothetical protein V865_000001 [Kwoniella europaea PYCC6329]|uniref:C2H2-type domain-containing protein n=1 Tax=Kwoniella europaea PYCC6329 TaxID=1423913 RepID=A0AAX4K7X8_9TREE